MKCGIFCSPVRWICHSWTWLSWTRQPGRTWRDQKTHIRQALPERRTQDPGPSGTVDTFHSSCSIRRTSRPSSVCSFCLRRARTARSSQATRLSLDHRTSHQEPGTLKTRPGAGLETRTSNVQAADVEIHVVFTSGSTNDDVICFQICVIPTPTVSTPFFCFMCVLLPFFVFMAGWTLGFLFSSS